MFEARQGGIEGALLREQSAAGDLLDARKNTVAMQRAEGDRFQNEKLESPGRKLWLLWHRARLLVA